MRGKLIRGADFLRKEGVRRFYFKTLQELDLYRRVYLLTAAIPSEYDAIPARMPLDFVRLGAEGLENHILHRPETLRGYLRRQLDAGAVCYGALTGSKLVGVSWTRMDRFDQPVVHLDLPMGSHEVNIFDSYTYPEYRGLGIQPALSRYIMQEMAGKGVTLGIRVTVPDNRSAMQSHAKSGFLPCVMYRRWRIGPLIKQDLRLLTPPANESCPPLPSFLDRIGKDTHS